jgi:HEAT repeat protein
MRQTSPQTRALIQQLIAPVSLWENLKGSRDEVGILSAIGNSNEPSAIIDILPFILAGRREVAESAAVAVHKLLLKTSANELIWLDWGLRRRPSYSGYYFYEWHKMSPKQLDLLESFGDASVWLLGMASFHHSGFVREAAIVRLDLITSGVELPFLILRINDWVSDVRDAAYEAIHSRLRPDYCRSFLANVVLVSRLEEAGRADHKALIEAIKKLLQGDECRTALLDTLKSGDRFTRRASFSLALNSTESDLPLVVRWGLADKDTMIRLWAAQRVSSAFEGATLVHFLELMKRDRFMPVRREALRIDAKRNSPGLLQELRSALLDAHPSMRDEARYQLRGNDAVDVAEFYRQTLLQGDERFLFSAISGLGETGSAADDSLIVPYTLHRAGRIRRAAIRALSKLNGRAFIELFIEALTDEVSYVSRQALKALANKASSVSGEQVWEIFQSTAQAHVKRNALSVIERMNKWDSIYYLVRTACQSEKDIADISRFGIQRWLARFNRSFLLPTPEQIAKLSNALDECGILLDEQTENQLRFSIRGFN